jgi:hypothetical protein
VLNLVWETHVIAGDMQAADDVSELRWFPRDTMPSDDEFAFHWLAPFFREWAAACTADAR